MPSRRADKDGFTPSDAFALYKGLFDNISSGVAIYRAIEGGKDFIFVDFNPAGEEIDQISRDSLIGRKVSEAFPGVREFGLLEVFQQVWATGESRKHPVNFYEDGRIAGWRDNHVFKLPGGEIVAVYDDLTAQKETENRFRQLAENIRDVFWVGSRDWQEVFYVSPTYEDVWGRSREELRDRPLSWLDAVHPEDKDAVMAEMANKAAGDFSEPRFPEYRVVRPDGELRWVSVRAYPVRNDKGDIVRIAGLAEDITPQKKLQQQLRRSERLAMLGRLTATVSHELRNPLGSIRAALFLLRRHLPDDEPRLNEALERIDRNVVRCDHIIEELLDTTRTNRAEIQTESVELDAWLTALLDEQDLPEGVVLEPSFTLAGTFVGIDPEQMRRAVINVVDNACQAMLQTEGRKTKAPARLQVATRKTGERVEMIATDTGPGIAAEVLPRIFEPLYSTKATGVGLGLPVVRQVLERHGGNVEVESRAGEGTSFTLWLPLGPREATALTG
jgi:PAS domain S-box-containing protein